MMNNKNTETGKRSIPCGTFGKWKLSVYYCEVKVSRSMISVLCNIFRLKYSLVVLTCSPYVSMNQFRKFYTKEAKGSFQHWASHTSVERTPHCKRHSLAEDVAHNLRTREHGVLFTNTGRPTTGSVESDNSTSVCSKVWLKKICIYFYCREQLWNKLCTNPSVCKSKLKWKVTGECLKDSDYSEQN